MQEKQHINDHLLSSYCYYVATFIGLWRALSPPTLFAIVFCIANMFSLLLGDNYTEAVMDTRSYRFRSTGSKPTITILVAIVVSGYRCQELELIIA